jgi:two-component system, cell cycle response regulator DivK
MSAEKRILVIEDNALNMKIFRILLGKAGYDTIEAFNAETGMELARERRPHLILIDIQLPGMDGLEATRLMKNDEELRHIPVLAVTSYAMPGDEQKAKAAGCEAHVAKPIETRNFIELIQKYVS